MRTKHAVRFWLAKLARFRSRATFVCVTGSSAKTTTVGLLTHVLAGTAPVQSQIGNNALRNCIATLRNASSKHRYAVYEIGTTGPGTIRPMVDLLRPSVGVVTLVRLEHFSAFRTIEAVEQEKGRLIEALPKDALAVLNHDDPRVLAMASRTRARVVTFGASGGDYRIDRTEAPAPGSLTVTIGHGGETFRIKTKLTGEHQNLAVAAAFASAHQLGIPPAVAAERMGSFTPLFGRCSAHFVDGGPTFIVDTKAPYHSVYLPLQMMARFSAPRKRIVIGQLSDLKGNPKSKYADVYRAARDVADQVIFVGPKAHRSQATQEDIAAQRFVGKQSVEDAAEFVKSTAIPGEIILVKSAQNLHLERIMLNFENEVRCWELECGSGKNCLACGRYRTPFARRKTRPRTRRGP